MKLNKWLPVFPLSGGVAGLLLIAAFSLTGWGAPGTAVYQRYELLNRLMAVALIFMALGWLGLGRQMTGYGRWAVLAAFIGTLLIALGTAAEFWLFSDLSYSGPSMRQTAYSTASLGGLFRDIAVMIIGVAMWRSSDWPRWLAVVCLLALVLDILVFLAIGTGFVVSALFALVIGWILMTNGPRFGIKSLPTS